MGPYTLLSRQPAYGPFTDFCRRINRCDIGRLHPRFTDDADSEFLCGFDVRGAIVHTHRSIRQRDRYERRVMRNLSCSVRDEAPF